MLNGVYTDSDDQTDIKEMDDAQLLELAENLRTGVPVASPVFDGAREDDIVQHADRGRARFSRAR